MLKKIELTNKNKILILLFSLVLLIGGIFAYFTDTDQKINKFTVGNVEVELKEDEWEKYPDTDGDGIPDIAEAITPNKVINKDPLIKNIGTNDAWVYMEVKIPIISNIITADTDGNKLPAGDVELFSFIKNEGWTQLGVKKIDDTGKNIVYVYGYNTSLKNGQSTPTLFDTIKFANIIEGQGIEKTNQSVIVTAKAIQTDGTGSMEDAYNDNFGDQQKEFELTLNTNGAQLPTDFKTIYENGTNVTLPTIEKEGYDFMGWYESSDFSKAPIDSILMDSDKVLYAKFELIEYSIDIQAINCVVNSPYDYYTIETPNFEITAVANAGYELNSINVNDNDISGTTININKGTIGNINIIAIGTSQAVTPPMPPIPPM